MKVNAHQDTDTNHASPQGGSTVGKEHQGNSRNRHDSHNHPYINDKVKEEHGKDSRSNIVPKQMLCSLNDRNDAEQNNQIQYEYHTAANKSPFFRKNAKDKVGALLGQKSQVTLNTL